MGVSHVAVVIHGGGEAVASELCCGRVSVRSELRCGAGEASAVRGGELVMGLELRGLCLTNRMWRGSAVGTRKMRSSTCLVSPFGTADNVNWLIGGFRKLRSHWRG